jgi:hypothetical protein
MHGIPLFVARSSNTCLQLQSTVNKKIQCILRTISEWNLAQGFLLHERSPTSLSGYIIQKVPLSNTILWVLLFWFGLGSSPFAGCFVQWSLRGFYHLFIYLHLISLSLAFKVGLQKQTQNFEDSFPQISVACTWPRYRHLQSWTVKTDPSLY